MPFISKKMPSIAIIILHTIPEIPNIIGNGTIALTTRIINPIVINKIAFITTPQITSFNSDIYSRRIEDFIKRSTYWKTPIFNSINQVPVTENFAFVK